MTINALTGSTTSGLSGNSTAQSQATTASSSVSPFLAKAEQRVEASATVASAQLSKFGLLKSALADGQQSAAAMSKLSATTSDTDVTTALGSFFKTFNASIAAANTAAASNDASSASASARRVVSDIKAALRADPATAEAMKKLGLTVQSDGSLVQDAKKFAASLASDPSGVRSAMASLGKTVDTVSTKELASNGAVGSALSSLTQRSTVLTAQRKALASLEQAMASSSQNSPTSNSGYTGMGLAAYLNNQSSS